MDFIKLLQQMAARLNIRHVFPSIACSAEDEPGRPTRELIELALAAIRRAADIDLSDISNRQSAPPYWPNIWPGEHYKLLAGIVQVLAPKLVLEIGTATGLSALAIKKYLAPTSKLVTFDVVPWTGFSGSAVNINDFSDGKLQQITENLCDLQVARKHSALLNEADFLFIDAAKDDRVEPALMQNFSSVGLKEGALLMFDDIRMLTMLPIWRPLQFPKLDVTSFGHWSGTGLAIWSRSIPWSAMLNTKRSTHPAAS